MIKDLFGSFNKKNQQRGAIFVMLALMLPIIFAFAGMAIDVGNWYAHYSRLQNAADAAALAGGKTFIKENEVVDSHPRADAAAAEYADANLPNFDDITMQIRVRVANDTQREVYAVRLTEPVPVYFLSALNLIGVPMDDFINIHADGFARIIDEGGNDNGNNVGTSNIFNNLFSFGSYFNTVNAAQNPDNPNLPNQIAHSCSYDGNIVGINQKAVDDSLKDFDRHALLTSEAMNPDNLTDFQSVGEAIDNKYFSEMSADTTMNMYSFVETANKMVEDKSKCCVLNSQNLNASTLNSIPQNVIYYNDGSGNLTIDLYESVTGPNTEPLYIVMDRIGVVNFHIGSNTNNTRPIILCVTGSNQWWPPSIHISGGNGATFNGTIYAPYCNVLMNENGGDSNYSRADYDSSWFKMYGNIIADEIHLKSIGHYFMKNYIGGDTTTPSNSKPNTNVHLSNGNDIDWGWD